MNTIKIGAKEYPLFMSVYAMSELEKACGDFSDIGDWLKGKDVTLSQKLTRITDFITVLINGGIARSNADINDGLTDGAIQNFITKDFVASRMEVREINGLTELILSTIRGGIAVSDDPNAPPVEKDVTLEELDKSKNAKSAAK